MRAIRIQAHGGPEVLKVDDVPEPVVSRYRDVVVKIRAAAMNHMDLWVRKGLPGVKIPLPITLGCEGAGVVEDVAHGSTHWKKGDEVIISPGTSCGSCEACLEGNDHYCREYQIYGEHRDGIDCEYKLVPEADLLPKPKHLTFEEAAAVPLAFLTAWQMLVDRGRIEPGQTVLIIAAGSGVGSAGVQIAKLFGAHVIATIGAAGGSDDRMERVKRLGADHVIDHYREDIAQEVKKRTDRRGADVIFEHVGAATWEKSLKSLAFGGRLVTCGATTGYEVKIDLRHLFIKQQQIIGSTMGSKSTLFKILRHVSEKRLSPVLDRVFPFSDAVSAHRRLEEKEQFGKIVLVPS